MQFHILTLFPDLIEPYLNGSILGRAQKDKLIQANLVNVRDFADDKHNTVDDTPYGGGAGMVMKVEPIDKALSSLKDRGRVVIMSARGQQFTQSKAEEYSSLDSLTLICGRYEGIDQRVIDNLVDEEISVGPYVLAGGEIPALTVVEAVSRLIPGVLGNPESNQDATAKQYTKPEEYRGWKVPEVLLSGDHAAITKWRQNGA